MGNDTMISANSAKQNKGEKGRKRGSKVEAVENNRRDTEIRRCGAADVAETSPVRLQLDMGI
jgi:hypothetical protein